MGMKVSSLQTEEMDLSKWESQTEMYVSEVFKS